MLTQQLPIIPVTVIYCRSKEKMNVQLASLARAWVKREHWALMLALASLRGVEIPKLATPHVPCPHCGGMQPVERGLGFCRYCAAVMPILQPPVRPRLMLMPGPDGPDYANPLTS